MIFDCLKISDNNILNNNITHIFDKDPLRFLFFFSLKEKGHFDT